MESESAFRCIWLSFMCQNVGKRVIIKFSRPVFRKYCIDDDANAEDEVTKWPNPSSNRIS